MPTDPLQYLAQKVGKSHFQVAASAGEMLTVLLRSVGCEGGEVIVPNHGCHSVAAAVVRAGAKPVFVDVGTGLVLDADAIARATSSATRAAVIVDQYGLPADHESIRDALPPSALLIADLAQSWDGQVAGVQSGVDADAVIMSFGPGKPITVGAGGAAFSNWPIQGIEQGSIGDRFASDVVSAARFPAPLLNRLGRAIAAADQAVRLRRRTVDKLRMELKELPVEILPTASDILPSWTRVPLLPSRPNLDTSILERFGSLQYPHDVPVADLPMFAKHAHRRVARTEGANDSPLLLKITKKGKQ